MQILRAEYVSLLQDDRVYSHARLRTEHIPLVGQQVNMWFAYGVNPHARWMTSHCSEGTKRRPLDTGQEPAVLQVAGRNPEGQNRSRYLWQLLAAYLLSHNRPPNGVGVTAWDTGVTITKSCQDSNAQEGSLADPKARLPPTPMLPISPKALKPNFTAFPIS